jgi:type I restriction enzyme, S subunit
MSKKKKAPYYPISQLCKVVDCEHKTAPYVESSEYLVVRTNNIRNGSLIFDDIRYTIKEGFIEWTQREIPRYGDVLFTREAPAGETCLVPPTLKICMEQRMVLLRPVKDLINPHFLSFYLTTKECKLEIYKYVIGSTVTRININDILKIKILCPSISEQEKIASFLGAIATRLTQLRRKHELLQTYKRGVMQKIFSQQIRFKRDDGKTFPNWEKKKLGEVLDFKNGINADKSKYGSGRKFINVLDIINGAPIYYKSIIGSIEVSELVD